MTFPVRVFLPRSVVALWGVLFLTAVQADAASMGEVKYVDVDGIRTRYFEGGTGEAMVLVHGGHAGSTGASAMDWMPIFPALAGQFHVYAVDMLGMGLTDPPGSGEEDTMQAAVGHLHRFMQTLGIDQVHLVGHSRGGLPGARIAIAHPELVKTLTLFDSNTLAPGELPPPPPPGQRTRSRPLTRAPGDPPPPPAPGPRNRTRSRPGGFSPTAEDEEWIRQTTERVRQRLRSINTTFQEDFSALNAGNLKTPTLMIWGFHESSGTSQPYRLGLELFEMISQSVDQAQIHFFNQARPLPYRDHPGEVAQLMISFIGRLKN